MNGNPNRPDFPGHFLPAALLATASLGFVFSLISPAAAQTPKDSAILFLGDDNVIEGELQESDDPDTLCWRSPAFVEDLEFPLASATTVRFPVTEPVAPKGRYSFELYGDDVFYGEIVEQTDEELVVDSERFGRVRLRRDHVLGIYPWRDAEILYLGPTGLDEWETDGPNFNTVNNARANAPALRGIIVRGAAAGRRAAPAANATNAKEDTRRFWADRGGKLVATAPGATLFRDFEMPAKAIVEFELSWEAEPNFSLVLGTDANRATDRRCFRLEAWDDRLVAVGESERDADVAALQSAKEIRRFRATAFIDQEKQQMLVHARNGRQLAALRIHSADPKVRGGIRLVNKQGGVALEYLRIGKWNGEPPESVEPLPEGAGDVKPTLQVAKSRVLRATYYDGQFSGKPVRFEKDRVILDCPATVEPLELPLDGMRSLTVIGDIEPTDSAKDSHRIGRLKLEGVNLRGRLVDAEEEPEIGASCLAWAPETGSNAARLRLGVSGEMTYSDASSSRQADASTPANQMVQLQARNLQIRRGNPGQNAGARVTGFGQAFKNAFPGVLSADPPPPKTDISLHLRSGDTVPLHRVSVGEEGVVFSAPITAATNLAHRRIKALELDNSVSTPKIEDAKRERLLTLPRMFRDSPPTQLVCSKSGDVLRCRVIGMDESSLRVEVRLEERTIPRDRVASIIWLHEDEYDDAAPEAEAENGDRQEVRVQAIQRDGKRLTFVAKRTEGGFITGHSDLLGECRANVGTFDRLLIGSKIEQSAADLALHAWRLQHAEEPKYLHAESEGDAPTRIPGTESGLVGKPAPTFELDDLDGKRFRLAEKKGSVIVLDFWATWCGPCLQTMPAVEQTVEQFADRGVELFAVNMEERPDQIRSVLERRNLNPKVILDRDGAVAAKYAVTAIPQTVVISADGTIERLYIGGGAKLAEQLRTALEELTARPGAPDS